MLDKSVRVLFRSTSKHKPVLMDQGMPIVLAMTGIMELDSRNYSISVTILL